MECNNLKSKIYKLFNRKTYDLYMITKLAVYNSILSDENLKNQVLYKLGIASIDSSIRTSLDRTYLKIAGSNQPEGTWAIAINIKDIVNEIDKGYIVVPEQINCMVLKDISPSYFYTNIIELIEKSNSMYAIKTMFKYYEDGNYSHIFDIGKSKEQMAEELKEWRVFRSEYPRL